MAKQNGYTVTMKAKGHPDRVVVLSAKDESEAKALAQEQLSIDRARGADLPSYRATKAEENAK